VTFPKRTGRPAKNASKVLTIWDSDLFAVPYTNAKADSSLCETVGRLVFIKTWWNQLTVFLSFSTTNENWPTAASITRQTYFFG